MNLHCMHEEKFIEPFIEFIEKSFDASQHNYVIRRSERFNSKSRENVTFVERELGRFEEFLLYAKHLNRADKIFLHGLFHNSVLLILFVQPWLLKKCYWLIWGGDLYHYNNRSKRLTSRLVEKIRAFVIRRIGHLITYIKGDYQLVQKWYKSSGKYCECLMYPSNLYANFEVPPKKGGAINILVGNSADSTNNHVDIFKKLESYKDRDIKIYCPLSYGPQEYAKKIARLGNETFGEKFFPLLDFMPYAQYVDLLGQIDIAIFAHKRQQGMGNTISLLGLGKKVYMRSDVTPWEMFNSLGIKVYDLEKINLDPIGREQIIINKNHVEKFFAETTLVNQWRSILLG